MAGSTSRSVASRSAKYKDQGGYIVIFLTDNKTAVTMLFLLLEAEERAILKYNSCLQCCPWEMHAVSKNVN